MRKPILYFIKIDVTSKDCAYTSFVGDSPGTKARHNTQQRRLKVLGRPTKAGETIPIDAIRENYIEKIIPFKDGLLMLLKNSAKLNQAAVAFSFSLSVAIFLEY